MTPQSSLTGSLIVHAYFDEGRRESKGKEVSHICEYQHRGYGKMIIPVMLWMEI